METCLTRRHLARLMIILLFTSCQTAPLASSKIGAKIKDGGRVAVEPAPRTSVSETARVTDQISAASDHGHHARVQIKVYRGPDDNDHTSYGYWVKQPADDPRHH